MSLFLNEQGEITLEKLRIAKAQLEDFRSQRGDTLCLGCRDWFNWGDHRCPPLFLRKPTVIRIEGPTWFRGR